MATDCAPPDDVSKLKCLVDGKDATTRGLCASCYSYAAALVKAGKTTWKALETAGLALPSKRKNAGPNAFASAFATVGFPNGQVAVEGA